MLSTDSIREEACVVVCQKWQGCLGSLPHFDTTINSVETEYGELEEGKNKCMKEKSNIILYNEQ